MRRRERRGSGPRQPAPASTLGCQCGNGAYASDGESVSASTPAPAARRLRDRVEDAPPAAPRANHEDHARVIPGADEGVRGSRRTMNEVPRPEWAALPFDEQHALACEEQTLLTRLGVVEAAWLAGLQHRQGASEIRKRDRIEIGTPAQHGPVGLEHATRPNASLASQAASRTLTTNHPSVVGARPESRRLEVRFVNHSFPPRRQGTAAGCRASVSTRGHLGQALPAHGARAPHGVRRSRQRAGACWKRLPLARRAAPS